MECYWIAIQHPITSQETSCNPFTPSKRLSFKGTLEFSLTEIERNSQTAYYITTVQVFGGRFKSLLIRSR